jgi:hypothetical protein
LGGPFYRRPGREAAENQLAPARCTTAAMMAHSAGDETARAGCRVRVLAQCTRGKAVPNSIGSGVMAVREREWRSAGIAPVKSRAGEKGLTGGARWPEEERAWENGAGAADGWGRSISGREVARRERGRTWRLGRAGP